MTARPGPVLVTGANSGFGLITVLQLAKRGWEAWGTVRSEAKAQILSAAAEEAGVAKRVHPLVLDVASDAETKAAFQDLPDFYGVVNNAGYSELGAVEEVSAERARAQLDINLVAPAIVSACALPGMRRLGGGRIVMVSSAAGRASLLPLNAWYHASKFGLEALSDVLRMEVAASGVKVSIVEPGFFKTHITEDARSQAGARADGDSPYAEAYRRTAEMLEAIAQYSPAPDIVGRTIVSAIESRFPLRRYLIGLDAHAGVAASNWLPRAVLDRAARFAARL
jgi:NAD(P)-dependent dehydrogenase (short-subunit alcohol dehydrogenase family)